MDFNHLLPEKPEFYLEDKPQKKEEIKKSEKLFTLKHVVIISVISGFLAGGLSSLYLYSELRNYVKKTNSDFTTSLGIKDGKYSPQTTQEESIIKTVRDVSPAVVSIIITKNVAVRQQYLIDPFSGFGDFFGSSQFAIPQSGPQTYQKQEVGGGTGVIISSDGMILTNKHVVLETDAEYSVLTNDGKKFPAKVLARDPVQDLAIIKIDQEKAEKKVDSFPVVTLGDSGSIEIGQTAIAIGNALGEYKNTISVGVISGLSRSITASGGAGFAETLDDIIQTDAAINEGNSGGPLLNLKGEVIGVNTAMVLDAQNIGFAIPINKAKRDIDQIKGIGKIVYPFLGVRYVLIDEKVKEQKDLSVDYGALVMRGDKGEAAVYPNSASANAGIKEGDIILEIAGEKVTVNNSLATIISKFSPKDKVQIKILRDKQEKTLDVVLDERPEDK